MKQIILVIMIILAVSLLTAEVMDYIVAKVGREVILRSDLDRQMAQMEQIYEMTPDLTEIDVINDMIESRLILQTARDRNYSLDEFRIRQMVDNQINHQISVYGSESALREELRKAGLSMSELRKFYDEMIREQRLKEMIIQNEITSRIHITEAEIEEYYEDNLHELPLRPESIELGMIRKEIVPSERTKRRILGEINRIYDLIREGDDFSDLAREHSDCPSSVNGGDLGFFARGTMIKEFEDVAFDLKPGEISKIVETHFGYHIIKMEEREGDEIRVRHILKMIEPSDSDVTGVVELMDDILLQLRDGGDFKQLAEIYSDDDSARSGGVIGEFVEDDYPQMFESQLQDIGIGEYTDVIREDNNLYIFGKLSILPERPFRLEEIREELREYLHTLKQIDHYDRWVNNLWEESYVEIF